MSRRPTPVYWRPSRVPLVALALLGAIAVGLLAAVETLRARGSSVYREEMLAASRTVERGIEHLRPLRGAIEPIDPDVDPLRSGLIGVGSSPVTSNSGHLPAKQSTINPNWGAVAVRLMAEAGVREGDVVAVAVSGSFPALNLAVYAAAEALGAESLVIVSASASQWGANVPGFLWVDMARELRGGGLISTRAVAATLGGREDRGIGIPDAGRTSIRRSVEQAELELVVPESYRAAVWERIARYDEHAEGRPIVAMVNVGGGTATTGPESVDHHFAPGLQRGAPARAFSVPSVLGHFLDEGVPVIHLSGIETLAERFGLPHPPGAMPRLGSGGVYEATRYRRWLAGLAIGLLLGATWFVTCSTTIRSLITRTASEDTQLEPRV